MKLKYIALMVILTAIITGTASADMSPALRKMPGNLHEMIYLQYREALNPFHEGSQGEGPYLQNPYQDSPYPHDPHFDETERIQYSGGSDMELERATLLLDENIKKADVISARLDVGIQQLREEGEDVSKLEALLEEYKGLMEEAKQYRRLAAEAYGGVENGTDFSGHPENLQSSGPVEESELAYLIESQKKMMAADRVLKDIFREFHHVTPGSEEIDGTEKLIARGKGIAVLSGSFRLEMHLENTELVIPEMTPDSVFYIKGDYEVKEISDTGRKVPAYIISSADVEISGAYKTVMLKSENISLTVREGRGYTALFGNGTYSIENEKGPGQEKNWGGFFIEDQAEISQRPGMIKPEMVKSTGLGPDTPGPEIGKRVPITPEDYPENNSKQ